MKPLAGRVRSLAPSVTMAVSERARQLRARGADVVDLGGGDPDFPTPEHICRAAIEAMQAGDTHYVSPAGTPKLRAAIARKLEQENQVKVDPADGVLVTPGGKAALFVAVQALIEPGSEVLLPEPAWVSFRPMVELAGGRVVPVALETSQGFRLTYAALKAAVTDATRLLIVNSPSNPLGRVLREDERQAIARVAAEHDLTVISDEIYEHVIYDGHRHVSLASLPELAERTLTCNGFSKAYAMTGWRLGWVAGPPQLLKALRTVHGHVATCAASFTQAAGVAALEGPQDAVKQMVAAWARRRDMVCTRLGALPGVRCPKPEGAFYAFPEVRGTGLSATEFTDHLLQNEQVAVTPGDAFGPAGAGHVRLSFATSDQELSRGLERIERFVNQVVRGTR
jgi:aspartate aminotransferase